MGFSTSVTRAGGDHLAALRAQLRDARPLTAQSILGIALLGVALSYDEFAAAPRKNGVSSAWKAWTEGTQSADIVEKRCAEHSIISHHDGWGAVDDGERQVQHDALLTSFRSNVTSWRSICCGRSTGLSNSTGYGASWHRFTARSVGLRLIRS
jgi:hypothetical protein